MGSSMVNATDFSKSYQAVIQAVFPEVILVEGLGAPDDLRVLDALFVPANRSDELLKLIDEKTLDAGLEWALVIVHDPIESAQILLAETPRVGVAVGERQPGENLNVARETLNAGAASDSQGRQPA